MEGSKQPGSLFLVQAVALAMQGLDAVELWKDKPAIAGALAAPCWTAANDYTYRAH